MKQIRYNVEGEKGDEQIFNFQLQKKNFFSTKHKNVIANGDNDWSYKYVTDHLCHENVSVEQMKLSMEKSTHYLLQEESKQLTTITTERQENMKNIRRQTSLQKTNKSEES